jgi:hypothetical protein
MRLLPGAVSAATYTSAFKVILPILGHDVDQQALSLAKALNISEEDAKALLMQEVAYSNISLSDGSENLSFNYMLARLNEEGYKISKAELARLFPEEVAGCARSWALESVVFEGLRVGVSTAVGYAMGHFESDITSDVTTNRVINGAVGLAAGNLVEAGARNAYAWFKARKVDTSSRAVTAYLQSSVNDSQEEGLLSGQVGRIQDKYTTTLAW